MSMYHLRWTPITSMKSVFQVYCHEQMIFEKYMYKYFCQNNICFTETAKPFLPKEFIIFLNDLKELKTTQYVLDGEESFYYNAEQNHLIFYMSLYSSNMKFILPDVNQDELLHCFTQFYEHTIFHE
jgi:hypothetical protein